MTHSRANVSSNDPETGGESWVEEASMEAGEARRTACSAR